MDLLDKDKLILFVAFVIPGFVSLKIYELLFLNASKDSASQLIDAVAYSCFNYAILLVPILFIEDAGLRQVHPYWAGLFYFFVLFVAPISWVCLLWWLRNTRFFLDSLPHPIARAWDYVFSLRQEFWVVIELKDGKKIGGKYSGNSFASSAPAPEQLYLEEAWTLNGDDGFERPREKTAGILLLLSEVVKIEFFKITYEGSNDQ